MDKNKGNKTVQSAVKNASKVSKRIGKWANYPENKKGNYPLTARSDSKPEHSKREVLLCTF